MAGNKGAKTKARNGNTTGPQVAPNTAPHVAVDDVEHVEEVFVENDDQPNGEENENEVHNEEHGENQDQPRNPRDKKRDDALDAMKECMELIGASVATGMFAASKKETKSMSDKVKTIIGMKTPEFYGPGIETDPETWLKGVKRSLETIQATEAEAVVLATFQLKDVANDWYDGWLEIRKEDEPPTWDEFEEDFREEYLSEEEKVALATQFEKLVQGEMFVQQYHTEFVRLSRYAPSMVPTEKVKMRHFVAGLAPWARNNIRSASFSFSSIAQAVGLAKTLEREKAKRNQNHDHGKNKKQRTFGGFSDGGYDKKTGQNQAALSPQFSSGGFQGKSGQGQNQKSRGYQTGSTQSQASITQPKVCTRFGKGHSGPCLLGQRVCFSCGDPNHIKSACPKFLDYLRKKHQGGNSTTDEAAGSGTKGKTVNQNQGGAPPRLFHAKGRQEAEGDPTVITGKQPKRGAIGTNMD